MSVFSRAGPSFSTTFEGLVASHASCAASFSPMLTHSGRVSAERAPRNGPTAASRSAPTFDDHAGFKPSVNGSAREGSTFASGSAANSSLDAESCWPAIAFNSSSGIASAAAARSSIAARPVRAKKSSTFGLTARYASNAAAVPSVSGNTFKSPSELFHQATYASASVKN